MTTRNIGVYFIIILPDILWVYMHGFLNAMDVAFCNKNRLVTNETDTWPELIFVVTFPVWASLVAQLVKNLPAMKETSVQCWEDLLEKGKAPRSSILAWRVPRTVWSMELQRVGHDWATFTLPLTFASLFEPQEGSSTDVSTFRWENWGSSLNMEATSLLQSPDLDHDSLLCLSRIKWAIRGDMDEPRGCLTE